MRVFSYVMAIMLVVSIIVPLGTSVRPITYGGRLSVGFLSCVSTLTCGDEWQFLEMGCVLWPLIYDRLWLLGSAPRYAIEPMLTKSWETDDGRTWTLHLVENATWHDGTPFTAEDVAFSFEYLPSIAVWNYTHTDAESISVINANTIEITLKSAIYHPPAYWTPILPKHIWEPYKEDLLSFSNDEMIGSGPFKLKEWQEGEYVWLVANENYWRGRPYLDEVVFKVYGSMEAMVLALKTGEIDMFGYDPLPSIIAEDLMKTANVTVADTPGIGVQWISFNLHKETALQDVNLRRAIYYGIDRDRIISIAYNGFAAKSDSFIYPELDAYNADLPQYEHSVTEATAILDSAGYEDTDSNGIRNDPETGNDLSFEMIVPEDWTDELKAAMIVKEDLEAIGISISLKVLDLATYYAYVYTPEEDTYEMAYHEEEPGPIPNDWIWYFALSYEAGGEGWNTAYYSNPTFDTLYGEMIEELNETKRNELLMEMQALIAEDVPYAFMTRAGHLSPFRKDKFVGFVPTMGGVSTWTNPWTYYRIHFISWLLTDINDDGTVNIVDITLVAKAFNSKLGLASWDPMADIDGSGLVNIVDISKVAKDFGKTAS